MHGGSVPHAAGMFSRSRSAATLGDGRVAQLFDWLSPRTRPRSPRLTLPNPTPATSGPAGMAEGALRNTVARWAWPTSRPSGRVIAR